MRESFDKTSPSPPPEAKIPSSRGYTQLQRHWNMEKLYRDQAIKAKCCECMGYFVDGRYDCQIPDCPLHPFMPYLGKAPPVPEDPPDLPDPANDTGV